MRVGDGWLSARRTRETRGRTEDHGCASAGRHATDNTQQSAAKTAPSSGRRSRNGPRRPNAWTSILSPGPGNSESGRG